MDWRRHAEDLFRHDEWNVGVVEAPISSFLDPGFRPVVRWLPVEPGTYLADPFGDGLNIWCEEWQARTGRGRLVRVDGGGRRWPQAGFAEGVHLSYPYVIREGGERYCVPECWESGAIGLYRSVGGDRWEQAATLVAGFAGVDATLFQHEGRWWMAAANQHDEPEAALYLWHAPALTGPWQPHRRHPVKRDLGSARPAGTPFRHAGALYRPAQDCSNQYGGAVVINRVECLTPDEFRETAVVRLAPPPEWRWNQGWHTLAAVGEQWTLLDARRLTFMPQEFVRVLRRKLRALIDWRGASRGAAARPADVQPGRGPREPQPGRARAASVARHFSLGRSRWSLEGGLRLTAGEARSARGLSKLPPLAGGGPHSGVARPSMPAVPSVQTARPSRKVAAR